MPVNVKGQVVATTCAYEQITAAIKDLPHGVEFSAGDVRARAPHLDIHTIGTFLSRKERAGWLERVRFGTYRIGGIRIKTRLPQGLVAEAVWAALFTNHRRRFMRLPEIIGDAEAYINRPGISLYSSCAGLLTVWHRAGHLERVGSYGEYGYRLAEGVSERPVTTSP